MDWIAWESFTPWHALGGGALIGLSASLFLVANGRVAGISGILGGVLLPRTGEVAWRIAFLVGLLAGGLLMLALVPEGFGDSPRMLPVVAIAGLLVGVGTRMGNGCTSGHGVCGLSRLSGRSLVAVLVFIATGAITAVGARMVGGLS